MNHRNDTDATDLAQKGALAGLAIALAGSRRTVGGATAAAGRTSTRTGSAR